MSKRTQGYLVTAQFFMPVDPKNISDTIAKATAIQAAEKGDLSKLEGAIVRKFNNRFTSFDTESLRLPIDTSGDDTGGEGGEGEGGEPENDGTEPATTGGGEAGTDLGGDLPPPGSPGSRKSRAK